MSETALVEALKKCRTQFASYAEQHAAKGTPEADRKARVNREFAVMCTDALAASQRPLPREGDWVTGARGQVSRILRELLTKHGVGVDGKTVRATAERYALDEIMAALAASPPCPDRSEVGEDCGVLAAARQAFADAKAFPNGHGRTASPAKMEAWSNWAIQFGPALMDELERVEASIQHDHLVRLKARAETAEANAERAFKNAAITMEELETAEAQLAEAKGEIERLDRVVQKMGDELLGYIEASATLTAQRDKLMEAGKPFVAAYKIQPPGKEAWPDDRGAREWLPGAWPTTGDFRALQAVHKSIGEGTGGAN